MPTDIDTRDFVPQYARQVTLPNGAVCSALWLDDITTDEFNQWKSDEGQATGFDVFDTLRAQIKRLMPGISDADLAALTMREVRDLHTSLMQWEFQAEEAADGDPLAASASTSPST